MIYLNIIVRIGKWRYELIGKFDACGEYFPSFLFYGEIHLEFKLHPLFRNVKYVSLFRVTVYAGISFESGG